MTDHTDLVARLRCNAVIHENHRCEVYNAALTDEEAADALEALAKENFALAAYQCPTAVIGEHGDTVCTRIEEQAATIERLAEQIAADRLVLDAFRECCSTLVVDRVIE